MTTATPAVLENSIVQHLRSARAGARPGDGTIRSLLDGEIFINEADGVFCTLAANGTMLTGNLIDLTKPVPITAGTASGHATNLGQVGTAIAAAVAPVSQGLAALNAGTLPFTPNLAGAVAPGVAAATASSKLLQYELTPYDFLDPSLHAYVRTGVVNPATGANVDTYPAIQAWLNALNEFAGDVGVKGRIPFGEWQTSQCARAYFLTQGAGKNRHVEIEFDRQAKFVPTSTNQYRFANLGGYDAAGNKDASSAAVNDATGLAGDAWTCISANDGMSGFSGVTNVNVGDRLWKTSAGPWQKILFTPRYHYQSWDAATNLDDAGNTVVASGLGEEGECYIVAVAGSTAVDGVSSWAIGDEAVFVQGAWRKKNVRGGSYQGTWNAATNTPALSNATSGTGSGTAGQWYIVIGSTAYAPIAVGSNGNTTGLGDSVVFQPGEKIWCVSPGVWRKAWASPTPRGTYNGATDQILTQQYPSTVPSGTAANTTLSSVTSYSTVGGKGAYGDLYEVTQSAGTAVAGTFLYFGAQGLETVALDPDWNCGFFHFILDASTTMSTKGRMNLISRLDGNADPEITNGIALRVHSTSRATGAGNYLYQGSMLDIEEIVSASDVANAATAQFSSGSFHKVVETKDIYLPNVRKCSILAAQSSGATRIATLLGYPRFWRKGIHYIDSYVPYADVSCNGAVETALHVENTVWDVGKSGVEGGVLTLTGAADVVDGIAYQHGYRGVPSNFNPTVKIVLKDTAFQRYDCRIHGHALVDIELGVPLFPASPAGAVVNTPAAVFLDDASNVTIHNGIPAQGYNVNVGTYTALVKTRGVVTGLFVESINISQLLGGFVFDLRHNSNTLAFNFGGAQNPAVICGDVVGYVANDAGPVDLCDGQEVFLQASVSAVDDGLFTATNAVYRRKVTEQGFYAQWNRDGGSGASFLVNQRGSGAGGVILGECDTSDTFTQAAFFRTTAAGVSGSFATASGIGVFGTAPISTKPTVSGSKSSNAALASLIAALASYGLIIDQTSA